MGRIVALDGDVKNSTYAEWFARKFPDRYFEARIAEQNMVSAAVGLSAGGKIPFCSTFAKFFERAYDQIEMAIISGANFKLTGSHAGVTLAADGPSQMSLPDVAFFRSFCHVRNYHGQPAVRYFFPRRRRQLLPAHRVDGQSLRLLLPAYASRRYQDSLQTR